MQVLQYLISSREIGIESIAYNILGAFFGIYFVLSIVSLIKFIFLIINKASSYRKNYLEDLDSIYKSETIHQKSLMPLYILSSFLRFSHFAFNKIISKEDNLNILLKTDMPHKMNFPVMSPSIIRHLLYGTSEKDTSVILSEQISPGDTVWDIGAHYGYFSLKASCLAGDKGKVLGIEPTPSTYKRLCENTSGIKNIVTYNLGFFSHNTSLTFNDYGENYSALNSLHEPRLDEEINFKQRYLVNFCTADNFLSTNTDIPNLIKMDCESSELDILIGMENLIKEHTPSFIMEFGDLLHKDIPRSKPIHDLMLLKGYRLFRRFKEGYKEVAKKDTYPYFNAFFVHENNLQSFFDKNPVID